MGWKKASGGSTPSTQALTIRELLTNPSMATGAIYLKSVDGHVYVYQA